MKSPLQTLPALISAALLMIAAQSGFAAETATAAPKAAASDQQPVSPPFLAVVNGKVLSAEEFEINAQEAARQKFYHGTPPEGAVDQLMREVGNRMINRVLLLEEAARRGIKPDAKSVSADIERYEARYSTSARWQQERDKILPSLRERLEQDSVLEQIEEKVRAIPAPPVEKVRAYYKANPDKFTEPEKMRLSIILLEVDPSSPTSDWEAAESEAAALVERIKAGEDFSELARKNSKHPSAEKGGDLGYLHRGMLPDGIQEKIDSMKPGQLSEATRVLQGYAVFRYEAFQAAKHHDFSRVRERAADLLARDLAEQAWNDFVAEQRKKAKIVINTQRYPALAAAAK